MASLTFIGTTVVFMLTKTPKAIKRTRRRLRKQQWTINQKYLQSHLSRKLWFTEIEGLCIKHVVMYTWWNKNVWKYLFIKADNLYFRHCTLFGYKSIIVEYRGLHPYSIEMSYTQAQLQFPVRLPNVLIKLAKCASRTTLHQLNQSVVFGSMCISCELGDCLSGRLEQPFWHEMKPVKMVTSRGDRAPWCNTKALIHNNILVTHTRNKPPCISSPFSTRDTK